MPNFRLSVASHALVVAIACVVISLSCISIAPTQAHSAFERIDSSDAGDVNSVVDDTNTIFVPDPRPEGMSAPLMGGQQTINSPPGGDFAVDRVRSADIGLWFDRSTADGLVVNDIGTGVISRLGFREGDRIFSVNGVGGGATRSPRP